MRLVSRTCEWLSVLICFGVLFFPGYIVFCAGEDRDIWALVVGIATYWLLFELLFWPVFKVFILEHME